MKKIILFAFAMTLFACSKKASKPPDELVSSKITSPSLVSQLLAEDERIRGVVNTTITFYNYLNEVIAKNKLDRKAIENKLRDLQEQEGTFDEGIIMFSEIMGTDMRESFVTYYKNAILAWNAIEGSNKITQEDLASAISLIIQEKKCGWRFWICYTVAVAGGVACGAGCAGVTVATAGISAVACGALCAIVYTGTTLLCLDNYCRGGS